MKASPHLTPFIFHPSPPPPPPLHFLRQPFPLGVQSLTISTLPLHGTVYQSSTARYSIQHKLAATAQSSATFKMKNKISHAPSHPSLICLISLFPSSTDDWHFSYLLTSFFLFQFNRSSSLQSSGLLSVAAAKLHSFIHGPLFIVRLLCVAAHAPCVQ